MAAHLCAEYRGFIPQKLLRQFGSALLPANTGPMRWCIVRWRGRPRGNLFWAHALVIIAIYALNLAWLNQPQVLPQTPPNQTVVHYEVSEYLPPVNTQKAKPEPPRRARPQKADPELAPQEIVVTNENHISTRQTIVQPSSLTLKQDVPLPNLIASTAIPGAPVAMNHPMQVLPVNVPQIAEPAQPVVQSRLRPLLFPPAAQPEVAAPAEAPASHRSMPSLPLESAIIVPPAPDVTARKPDALQLPAQAPPQVAAPAPEAATSHAIQSMPLSDWPRRRLRRLLPLRPAAILARLDCPRRQQRPCRLLRL